MIDELRVCLGEVATVKLRGVLLACVDIAKKNAITPPVPVGVEEGKSLFDKMREAVAENTDEESAAKKKALFAAMRKAAESL